MPFTKHPLFKSPWALIETHCHLDYLKQDNIEDIVKLSHELNIEKIITISVDPENIDQVLKIAERFENVFTTQGIHPHDSIHCDDNVLLRVKNNLKHHKVKAVGEIGLDYHYNNSPQDIQRKVFEQHLELAVEAKLPVVIHSREADDDTISILKKYDVQGVIHSFTSGIRLAEFAIDKGMSLGFNGITTFKTAENVREALRITPLDQIILETDAPFLTPMPHRGKENAPFFLPFIAKYIAEFKQIELELLCTTTYKNSCRLFNL